MKPQTCCCHICKTSLNQYKREFLPCSTCNKIVCRNCFGTKHKGSTWEEAVSQKDSWICPSCDGTCQCPRCKKKPKSPFDQSTSPVPMKTSSPPQTTPPEVMEVTVEDDQDDLLFPKQLLKKISSERSPTRRLKPGLKKLMNSQLEELVERERRIEFNIFEMERMLLLMRSEKDEILLEKTKVESLLTQQEQEA